MEFIKMKIILNKNSVGRINRRLDTTEKKRSVNWKTEQ